MMPTDRPFAGLRAERCASRATALRRGAVGWLAAVLGALALMPGCGGGGLGSGGTGAPLALGSGTVTGFGSVIVDGVTYDDSQAQVQVDDLAGGFSRAEARLGQQVEIEFDSRGAPSVIRVGAQLVGQIDRIVAPGRIVVLGREVLINDGTALGPVTVLDGLAGIGSLAAGQWVEVHGVDGAGDALQATRLQRLVVPPVLVRASGRIAALGVLPGSFRLAGGPAVGGATALRLPSGIDFAVGQRVTVLARAGDVSTLGGQTIVAAALVRVRSEPAAGQRVSVAGLASDVGPASFVVGGWRVDYTASVVEPAGSLVAGAYVRVEGEVASTDRLIAREVKVRSAQSTGSDIELKGNVTGLSADRLSFSVRGVPVTVQPGVSPQNCPGGQLAEGVYLELKARLGLGSLVAREIECKAEQAGSVVTREGLVQSVDTAASRFVLQVGGVGGQTVEWNALTFFRDLSPATLAGRAVEVDGVVRASDGVLVARRVRPGD